MAMDGYGTYFSFLANFNMSYNILRSSEVERHAKSKTLYDIIMKGFLRKPDILPPVTEAATKGCHVSKRFLWALGPKAFQ